MEKDEQYYESLDKRTREYKDYVARKEQADAEAPQGLGDKVEKVLEATGVASVVKLFANGEDCGCDERKAKLNELFPANQPECFTEAEYNLLKDWKESGKTIFVQHEQLKVLDIFNRVMHTRIAPSSCSGCFANNWNKLMKLLDEYDQDN